MSSELPLALPCGWQGLSTRAVFCFLRHQWKAELEVEQLWHELGLLCNAHTAASEFICYVTTLAQSLLNHSVGRCIF